MKTSFRILIAVIGLVGLSATLIGSFNKGKTSADTNSAAVAAVSTASATSQPTAAKADASAGENVWVYQPQITMQAGQPIVTRHYLLFTTHPCNLDWMVNSRGGHIGSNWKFAVYVMDATHKPDFTNPLMGGCWYNEDIAAKPGQLKPTTLLVYAFNLTPDTIPEGFDTNRLIIGPQAKTLVDEAHWADFEKADNPNPAIYIKECAENRTTGVCAAVLPESEVQSLNVKLGFPPPALNTAQATTPTKPAPTAKVGVVEAEDPVAACESKKIAAFRKEEGEDALVTADMAQEWEGDCKKQFGK